MRSFRARRAEPARALHRRWRPGGLRLFAAEADWDFGFQRTFRSEQTALPLRLPSEGLLPRRVRLNAGVRATLAACSDGLDRDALKQLRSTTAVERW